MFRIPPEKIEEIRSAVDIVDVVSAHVQLKKRGKNYVGLCPFHHEKTPSFNVSPEKSMYYCFGCHEGGNAISFLMAIEKVTFVEAVRSLAERAGIALQYEQESDEKSSLNEELYAVCKTVANYYHQNMMDTNEGRFGLEYFKLRGFTAETIKTFGLGYSMNGWDSLVTHAKQENIPAELLEKAGLAKKRDDGTYYDTFRGRAMFPILSTTGRVIAFGARKLYEDDRVEGKYINSPETPIYSKSRTLYGLFQAKDAIREKDSVLLVEGYADLISLYQAGFKNVTASSGTALTVEQVQLISRYTKKIFLLYDADAAGSKAALRGAEIILEQGMDVQVVELPSGYDPDKFVKEKGAKEFQKLLEGAISFIDFVTRSFEQAGKLDTPEGQAEAVRTIVRMVAKIDDDLKRGFYLKHLSEKYKIYESLLYRELEKYGSENRSRNARRQSFQEDEAPSRQGTRASDKAATRETSTVEIPAAERELLHAMLAGGLGIVQAVSEHVAIQELAHPYSRFLVERLYAHLQQQKEMEPAELIDEIEDERLKQSLSEIVFSRYHISKRWEEQRRAVAEADPATIARGAIIAIKKRAIEKAMEENSVLLRDASKRNEDISRYQKRNQELLEEKKKLEQG
jgi:DNA primase